MSNILNNTTSLQEVLEALQNKAVGGIELPELTNEGTAADLLSGKQLIDGEGNIVTGTITNIQQQVTYTPTTKDITLSGAYFGKGVTLKGDSNLVADNIKSGVNIFGVQGNFVGDNAGEISLLTRNGASFYNSQVTRLGEGAFAYYSYLKTVSFPACERIGSSAFTSCSRLSSVSFPVCTEISIQAFANCSQLSSVEFPACTNIASSAFQNCTNLATISFPACQNIWNSAFQNCTNLATISFPACRSIWNSTFCSCYKLTSISFPVCTYIGPSAFKNCSQLTSVSFPACPSVGLYAFDSCSQLTSVSFPVCTCINQYAFKGCSNLTSVNFPVCTLVSDGAFYNCYKLTSVSFPVCTSIRNDIFYRCYQLTSVSFPVCTYIGQYAFRECSNLTSVEFGRNTSNTNTQAYIGSSAFYYCKNLTNLTLYYPSVATLSNTSVFYSTPMSNSTLTGSFGSIYVPASLVNVYKSATNWAAYASRIAAIPGTEEDGGSGDAGGDSSLTTFTYESTTYQKDPGMTWAEWVNSDYNISGFTLEVDGVLNKLGNYVSDTTIVYLVQPSDVIDDRHYIDSGSAPMPW